MATRRKNTTPIKGSNGAQCNNIMPEDYDGSYPLLDDLEEAFCQTYIAVGLVGAKAYREVYGDVKAAATRAWEKLERNKAIYKRVQYLKAENFKKLDMSVNKSMQEIKQLMQLSLEKGKVNDYVKLQELVLKLQNGGVQKIDVTTKGNEMSNTTNVIVDETVLDKVVDKFKDEF